MVSKQEVVLGSQGGHRQNALFVTLKLELVSNFCMEILGRDLTLDRRHIQGKERSVRHQYEIIAFPS